MTENHSYRTPSQGTIKWHKHLNQNFRDLDTDVEVRDAEANLGNYNPKEGSKFLATDTGSVYLGDGSQWNKIPENHGVLARDFAELEQILRNTDDKDPTLVELLPVNEVGKYKVRGASSLPIRVPDGVHIRGYNPDRWGAGSPKAPDEAITTITLQDVPGGDFNEEVFMMGSNTTIENVTFSGGGPASTRTVIKMNGDEGSNDCTLDNVTFWNIHGHAVLCQGGFGCTIRGSKVKNCGDDGTKTNNGDPRAALKVTNAPDSGGIGQLAVIDSAVISVPDNPYRCHTITRGGARSDIIGCRYKINEGDAGIYSNGQLRIENSFVTCDNSAITNALIYDGGGLQRKLKDVRIEKSGTVGLELDGGTLPQIVNELVVINCDIGIKINSASDNTVWNDIKIRGCGTAGMDVDGLEGWTMNGVQMIDNGNWHIDTRDTSIETEQDRRPFLINGAVFAGEGTVFPNKHHVDIRNIDAESSFQRRTRQTSTFDGDGQSTSFKVRHGLSFPNENVTVDDLLIDVVPTSTDAQSASPVTAYPVDTGGTAGNYDSIEFVFVSPPNGGTDNVSIRWGAELMMGDDHTHEKA